MTTLTPTERASLIASRLIIEAPPPVAKKRRYVVHVQRPAYLNGLPTIATCRATNTCVHCRVKPATLNHSKCDDCIEIRRAKARLGYARRKGE